MPSELRFDALGTRWIIELPIAPETKLQSRLTQLVAEFQANYTRFNSNSLLGLLNDTKQLHNPPEEMVNMLEYALDMYKKSQGLFNISIGSQLEKDGYGLLPDHKARVSENLEADMYISSGRIQIAEHVRLDFGGFGKGWLVEQVHALLNSNQIEDHVINAGGDIRVGVEPKTIFVESPIDSTEIAGSVVLQNEGFAASSNSKRRWYTKTGKLKAHIIHPHSELESQSVQVCIKAPSCLLADTVATVVFLSSKDKYQDIADQYGVEYLVLAADAVEQSGGFGFFQNPNSST